MKRKGGKKRREERRDIEKGGEGERC